MGTSQGFQSTLPRRGPPHAPASLRPWRVFQPTPPGGGATLISTRTVSTLMRNFNPRSPCGERPTDTPSREISSLFQSTLPVRGATPIDPAAEFCCTFQSTLPVRGATVEDSDRIARLIDISIHAPRAGSDCTRLGSHLSALDFNPRSPCGERQHKCTFFKCVFMKKNLEFVICSSLYVISCRRQQRLSTSSYKYPCEPIQILMYASASLYRISGSSGRYVCLQPKCSILSS